MDQSISIITPSFNYGRYIEQCVRGVLWQNYSKFEHIIIDGGSKDGTIDILNKYNHLKWISEPDRGLSDALNKGIRMASGQIIGWCCADDYYLPGTFNIIIEIFKNDPSIEIVYGDYREIDAEGRPIRIRREIDFDLFILKYLHVNYIPTASMFWRRELHENGFWFNEKLDYSMDYDFILRIALAGHKFKHISTLLADFRRHPDTKSASGKQRSEQELYIRANLPILQKVPPYAKFLLRNIFLLIARTKRTFIRGIKGHLFEQRWRS